MKRGGFDVVIGNPPWGQKAVTFSKYEKLYFKENYPVSTKGILDLSRFFIERSLAILNNNGFWGQVLPDIILLKNYDTTRKLILSLLSIKDISYWGMAFDKVNIDACTIAGQIDINKEGQNDTININIHNHKKEVINNGISQSIFSELEGYKFNIYLNEGKIDILSKLKKLKSFSTYFDSHEGIHSGNIRNRLFVEAKGDSNHKKLIFGKDSIKRYYLFWNHMYVHYSKAIINKSKGEYAGLGKTEYFENPKIVIRRTGDYIVSTIDYDNYYVSNNVFVCLLNKNLTQNLEISLQYFIGLLNSKLVTWYYRTIQPGEGKLFAELKINVLNTIPIPKLDLSNSAQKSQHDKMVSLVDQMLATQKKTARDLLSQ